jgi:hypothetical protein
MTLDDGGKSALVPARLKLLQQLAVACRRCAYGKAAKLTYNLCEPERGHGRIPGERVLFL